jgi:hypothetical protein
MGGSKHRLQLLLGSQPAFYGMLWQHPLVASGATLTECGRSDTPGGHVPFLRIFVLLLSPGDHRVSG